MVEAANVDEGLSTTSNESAAGQEDDHVSIWLPEAMLVVPFAGDNNVTHNGKGGGGGTGIVVKLLLLVHAVVLPFFTVLALQ